MNLVRVKGIEELRPMVLDALGGHDAAVRLFGSCARGQPRQHSNIDIAILPRDDLPPGFFAELEADIEESTTPMTWISSICGTPTLRLSRKSAARA